MPNNGCCKKHPNHRQSPGVCSLCLRHKLSQLSSASMRKTTLISSCRSSSTSSSLSSYCSSSSSSCASPTLPFPFHKDSKSGSNSVSIFLLSAKHGGVLKTGSMSVLAIAGHDRFDATSSKQVGYEVFTMFGITVVISLCWQGILILFGKICFSIRWVIAEITGCRPYLFLVIKSMSFR